VVSPCLSGIIWGSCFDSHLQVPAVSVRKCKNPFYTLLIPVGLVFVVTVCAYGFMAHLAVNTTPEQAASQAQHPLVVWMKHHGTQAVFAELAVLAVLTFAAILTDGWWVNTDERAGGEDAPARRK
jgi:hypothetical protein